LTNQIIGRCCHHAVTTKLTTHRKLLEALNYMVSQGRFELPTFPLGGLGVGRYCPQGLRAAAWTPCLGIEKDTVAGNTKAGQSIRTYISA